MSGQPETDQSADQQGDQYSRRREQQTQRVRPFECRDHLVRHVIGWLDHANDQPVWLRAFDRASAGHDKVAQTVGDLGTETLTAVETEYI